MDQRSEIRDFLVSRRERLTPEQAGLQTYATSNRRVKGLRREEVAMLSGVSVEYYTRLERGSLQNASDSVLDALSRALQLDEAERAHLFDLAHAASARRGSPRASSPRQRVRPGVEQLLASMTSPAYVRNGRLDVLATNTVGAALFSDIFDVTTRAPNLARAMFLAPGAREFYVDWVTVARDVVSTLRAEAGRNPLDKPLSDLVGELCTRSDEFAAWWGTHDVRFHRSTRKKLHHSVVGDLEVTGEAMALPGDEGLTVITFLTEPSSPSARALEFLASWAGEGGASVAPSTAEPERLRES